MTAITDARPEFGIQEEETRFRAPTSESMFTRVGGAINHIMNRQYDSHAWHLNGEYNKFGTAAGPDGVMPIMFDMEVVGYIMYSGEGGSSGTTILDIHRLTGGTTDAGTIFTTRPQLSTAAADGTYSFIDVVNSVDLALPAGHTKAVFNSVLFDRGEALRLDLDSSMVGAMNLNFQILFRPR
jgi:hypothetical protein